MSDQIAGSAFYSKVTVFFRTFVDPALASQDIVVDSNGRSWVVETCEEGQPRRRPSVKQNPPAPVVKYWNINLTLLDDPGLITNFDKIKKVDANEH